MGRVAPGGYSGDTVPMASTTQQGLQVLYTREQIATRVAEMGADIARDLNGEKLVMVGVLKGAAPFLADLARAVEIDATFDFVAVSSYGKGQRTSGAVKLIKDLDESVEGKNVLIVEDILDTGLTLSYLRKLILQQRPKTLRIAALLRQAVAADREDRRRLCWLLHTKFICNRLRNGLCGAVPEPARHLPDDAGPSRIKVHGNHPGNSACRVSRLQRAPH